MQHTHARTQTRTCTHTHAHTRTHTRARIHTHTHKYMFLRSDVQHTHARAHTHTHTHTHAHARTHAHTRCVSTECNKTKWRQLHAVIMLYRVRRKMEHRMNANWRQLRKHPVCAFSSPFPRLSLLLSCSLAFSLLLAHFFSLSRSLSPLFALPDLTLSRTLERSKKGSSNQSRTLLKLTLI